MRNWRWLIILVLVAGLALNLTACGGGEQEAQPEEPTTEATEAGGRAETIAEVEPTEVPVVEPTEAPTEEPTVAPTEEPEPEPTQEEEEELDLSLLGDVADFTSYRSRVVMTLTGTEAGEEVEQSIEMLVEVTTDPPAQHLAMTGSMLGPEAGVDAIEMYTVEDTTYMKLGDEWMSVSADEVSSIDEDLFAPDTFLADSCGWKKERDTEVLGVRVHHWSVDKDSLERCATVEMLEGLGVIHDFTGDVYVAVDGGYMVQMDLHYEGEDLDWDVGVESEEQLEEASFDIHFEYTDVNEPFTIEVPEEALAASGLPDDIPLPEGAGTVSSMFGMLTFETTLSGQEVYDFYLAEMPDNGWTQDSDQQMGTLYMMEYSKGARSVSFMISEDEDTGKTSVMITVTEE